MQRPVPWTTQPPQGVPVDTAHPLASALRHLWLGDDLVGRDRIGGLVVAPYASAARTALAQGYALTSAGGAGTAVAGPDITSLPYVQFGYGFFSSPGGAWVLSTLNSSGGGYLSRLALGSATTVQADLRFNFGTQRAISVTLPTTVGVPICALLVVYSSTDYRLFVNGQKATGTASPGTFGSLDRMWAPGDTLNGGLWATGFGNLSGVPDEVALRLTADPQNEVWQMFAPTMVRRKTAVAGVTVTPDTSALALSSYAPSVGQPLTVEPGAATLASAGYAPTLSQALAVQPAQAALVLAGYAPALGQSHTVQPAQAALSLGTFAPSIGQAKAVQPANAALALVGYDPTIGQAIMVQPGNAALTVSGAAPSITQTNALSPSPAALATAGYAPTIGQPQAVSPGQAALTVGGYAPIVSQVLAVSPGVAQIIVAGSAPTISRGTSVTPDPAALTLSAFAPTVGQGRTVFPGAATALLSGYAPTVLQSLAYVPTGSIGETIYVPASGMIYALPESGPIYAE